ncbi:MAG: type III-B CRISPR-associated protein Cas10/Cmr2 [archaeon]
MIQDQKKFIAIFQIGPVQEFISTARKTSDFWAGSYLLSYLVKTAIEYVQQNHGEIIYPEFASELTSVLTPNIPNRFVVKFDTQNLNGLSPKKIMEQTELEVKKKFKEIATSVKSKIKNSIKINDSQFLDAIFDRQCEDLFEIYWIMYPENGNNFSNSYSEAEVIFDARKSIRDFKQMKEEKGFKCTMCGKRETINDKEDGSLNRKYLIEFWDKIREAYEFKFNEDEHLCSVCTTKRLFDAALNLNVNVPSTASIAVSSFIEALITELKNESLDITSIIEELKELSYKAKAPLFGNALPKIKNLSSYDNNLENLAKLEGSWYYEDTYSSLIRESSQLTANSSIIKFLREAYDRIGTPSKYYAIIQVDGDNIGKCLRGKDEKGLKEFSDNIFKFSSDMISVVEKRYLAKVVYFGGDEGVIFSSLRDFLSLIDFIRNEFKKYVPETTISFGVAVAHYKEAMQGAIETSRKTIKEAKDIRSEKNALGISVIKRSGESLTSFVFLPDSYNTFDPVKFLLQIIEWYTQEKISIRWWEDIALEEANYIYSDNQGSLILDKTILNCEIKRLFKKRVKSSVKEQEINDMLKNFETFVNLLPVRSGLSKFINFISTAEFIAREG